ncbi:transcription termination factor Rho, partial [uncultured Nocardioides sp.]
LLAELKTMAGGMGIAGAASMKKAQLVDAIKAAQSGGQAGGQSSGQSSGRSGAQPAAEQSGRSEAPAPEETTAERPARAARTRSRAKSGEAEQARQPTEERSGREESRQQQGDRPQQGGATDRAAQDPQDQPDRGRERGAGQRERTERTERNGTDRSDRDRTDRTDRTDRDRGERGERADGRDDRDEDGGSRRNRRRRGRDRDRDRPQGNDRGPQQPERTRGNRGEPDTTILEDDVLVPAAGILDVLDNYAFVRTSGYLPGTDDVYVSLSMVRRFGLRRGDAVMGQVRQPREGERKEKFNPMVRIDSVNGGEPEAAKDRPEFSKFTPLHATDRLRLETDHANLIGRVIDIAAPIGKGQRGLIVSPPKAGKTMVLQSIANSISANNPECHLMVVLVDERPEEVTDFQRTVKGEVIASTFDRPATDHTMVAELAIERAKRLVELGHDVVVLLDSITRLGRAYNLAAPASGRILSGGVDSSALYPPKRFFGAARNIENGGSLTILATALVETGSKMDEVIFEEFKGTGNMELRLRREFADKRIFPAIDAVQSGTRREELLMSKEETAIVWKLRRVLSSLDSQQALELLLERLRKSQTNIEFLLQVQKTTPSVNGGNE